LVRNIITVFHGYDWVLFGVAQAGSISENIRTELHFLYIESPPELNTNLASIHIGLSKFLFYFFFLKNKQFNTLAHHTIV